MAKEKPAKPKKPQCPRCAASVYRQDELCHDCREQEDQDRTFWGQAFLSVLKPGDSFQDAADHADGALATFRGRWPYRKEDL